MHVVVVVGLGLGEACSVGVSDGDGLTVRVSVGLPGGSGESVTPGLRKLPDAGFEGPWCPNAIPATNRTATTVTLDAARANTFRRRNAVPRLCTRSRISRSPCTGVTSFS